MSFYLFQKFFRQLLNTMQQFGEFKTLKKFEQIC